MFYKKKDKNQNQIVWELTELGFSVYDLHNVGGFVDIIVGFEDNNYLFEIKTPKGYLSKGQKEFFASWRGNVTLIRCTEDAINRIKMKTNQRKTLLKQLKELDYEAHVEEKRISAYNRNKAKKQNRIQDKRKSSKI